MDHREQMQKEADQWQNKSVKLVQGLRCGMLIFGILVVVMMLLFNLGFPREVNEALPAIVITEDGQTLECSVEIRGEVTVYPLNPGKYAMEDSFQFFVNGNRLGGVYYWTSDGCDFMFSRHHYQNTTTCIMSVQRDLVCLETDVQRIFPEMDRQRAVVVTGARNAEEARNLLMQVTVPSKYADEANELLSDFRWFTD